MNNRVLLCHFPYFNSEGKVLGILNVASDLSDRFDNVLRNDLASFANLVGGEIENCLIHHELKLREARDRIASEKIVSAKTEDETIRVLVEEVRQQIPRADWIVLHQYNIAQNGELSPVCRISREATSRLFSWSNFNPPEEMKLHMRMGEGIAGQALKQRDTIIVNDVNVNPWYIKSDNDHNIKSLLVAPLYHPNDDHVNEYYGTLSLASQDLSAFNLDDETIITYLSSQASYEIAKYRDFERWRKHGGTLRKVLQQIQSFDIATSENQLCKQITDSAINLFGCNIARLHILYNEDDLVATSISSASPTNKLESIGTKMSYDEVKPLLVPQARVESTYLIRYGEHSKWNQNEWDAFDALVTPLYVSSGNLIGILTLEHLVSDESVTSRQILEAIGVFASAASWVIELSRFQRSLIDQKQRAQSFIDTISRELAKGRDLNTICEVVVQVGAKFLSAEGCSLYLVRGENIVLTHSNYLASTDLITRDKPISSRPKSGLTAWVADTGETVFFNNQSYKAVPAWAGEVEHLQYLPSKRCESVLLAPVKDGKGKVIGVISLENKKTLSGLKDFNDEDKEHLLSLANEFAKALEVIGLYDDIREWERTGLAEDIHDLINLHHSGIVSWVEALDVWLKRGDYQKVQELTTGLRQHALTFVQELRTLHTNFLAQSFEAPTFRQALEQTLSAWTKNVAPKYPKEKMRVSFNCPENLEIPVKIRNTIIRFASLAFSNAIRHSGIDTNPEIEVSVNVEQKDQVITLTVNDNGPGIDYQKNPPGYGLDRINQLAEKI